MISRTRILPVVLFNLIALPSMTHADRLVIQGASPGEKITVLANATSTGGGCFGSSGTGWVTFPVPVANATTRIVTLPANLKAGCSADIAVFAENHAVNFIPKVNIWTDGNNDSYVLKLKAPILVRINVWLVTQELDAAAEAIKHVNLANEIYELNKVGIRLVFGAPVAVPASERELIKNSINQDGECTNIPGVQGSGSYKARRINVYYVDENIGGRNCALKKTPATSDCNCVGSDLHPGDASINYVGIDNSRIIPSVLAHELAHAFGVRPGPCGGHILKDDGSGFEPGFSSPGDDSNVMSAATDRSTFTLGQIFRMNTHKVPPGSVDKCRGSLLNDYKLRTGPTRACKPRKNDRLCPALSKN